MIDRGAEIIHQSHITRLTGVAILGVIGFAAGHIVEHEQRAVVPLSPITGQQHGNLVFIVGTHGLQEPIVPQQIFIGLISGQFQGSVGIFFSIQTLSYLGDPKLLKGKGGIRMQQPHDHSIRKSAHKHIVLFPLGGSAIKGKRADFTSNHRVAHNLFSQLSFFLQCDIDTSIQGHFSHQ